MDLDGQWNPPEEWPESNPPLPGWTRGPDGLWSDPRLGLDTDDDLAAELDTDAPPNTPRRPQPERPVIPSLESLQGEDVAPVVPETPADERETTAEAEPLVERRVSNEDRRGAPTPRESALSFAEATANLSTTLEADTRLRRQGLTAALLAAVTASMLGAGLVLLLLLL